MFREVQPKFVKRYDELGDAIVRATERYVSDVQNGAFPEPKHSFGMAASKALGEPTGARPVVEEAKPEPAYGPADDR
jgi:hypothetical protein